MGCHADGNDAGALPGKPTKHTKRKRSAARVSPEATRTLRRLERRVKILRQRLGLTQEEAAARANLDWKHWQLIEGSRPGTNPTVATLVGVAHALEVDLAELFSGDD